MTGFYSFTFPIFDACRLVYHSDCNEYEPSDAIGLLLHSGWTIDAIRMDDWRIDVGYPEDCDRAERLLREQQPELSDD